MPTTVTATIGTGGGYDYSTIGAWESGTQGDCVAADEIRKGVVQQVGYLEALSAAFVVAGATTDATRYRELTVLAGASFVDNIDPAIGPLKYDTSKGAAIEGANITYTVHFNFNGENYFRTSRLQWKNRRSAGMAVPVGGIVSQSIIYASAADGGANPLDTVFGTVENCLIVQDSASVGWADLRSNAIFNNCTFVKPSDVTSTADPMLIRVAYQSGQVLTNCALFATSIGGIAGSGVFTFVNCFTNKGSPPSGCTEVAFDESTGSGFEENSSASSDWRIRSTSALKDAGTSSGAPSVDIFNQPRDASIDVGAFELAAIAAAILMGQACL